MVRENNRISVLDIEAEEARLYCLAAVSIDKARLAAGLTKRDLAERLDVSVYEVERVLDGQADFDFSTLARFSLACDTRFAFQRLKLLNDAHQRS